MISKIVKACKFQRIILQVYKHGYINRTNFNLNDGISIDNALRMEKRFS